jgi:glycosyltransferase involved in cell wall biosynthesis
MKILVIIHEFPPIGGGGGLIARDLAIALVQRGHQVRVVTAHYGSLPEKEDCSGVEVIRLRSGRKEAFRAKLMTMARFILAASKYSAFEMKDFEPDLIHAHFAVPGGPAAKFAASRWKIPYVLTVHLGDIPDASPEKTGKWFRFLYPFTHRYWNKAAAIVSVSEFSRKIALRKYNVPIQVIPNGIDYQAVKIDRIEPHSVPKIVFAGRFVPQKNLLQIVEVCKRVKDLNWQCTLIGDGQDRAQVEAAILEAGIQDNCSISGWVTPEEVTSIFKQSDIFFMPSRSEGLPISGIQAMTCGLALLLSTAGGNPEIVEVGKNGFVYDPNDTTGFAAALRNLLTDEALLLSCRENSLEMAARYDIRLVAAQYEAVFQSVLQK